MSDGLNPDVHNLRLQARSVDAVHSAVRIGRETFGGDVRQTSLKVFAGRVTADLRLTGVDAPAARALADALVELVDVEDARVEHGWARR